MASFFILPSSVDPVKSLETMKRGIGFSEANGNFYNISLGEGQEDNALNSISKASREGGWAIIQNLHVMENWL
jgi:dynein heavy chain